MIWVLLIPLIVVITFCIIFYKSVISKWPSTKAHLNASEVNEELETAKTIKRSQNKMADFINQKEEK